MTYQRPFCGVPRVGAGCFDLFRSHTLFSGLTYADQYAVAGRLAPAGENGKINSMRFWLAKVSASGRRQQ